jgi:hypothetical protein
MTGKERPPFPETDWKRPWPELKEFQRWNLPVGTIISAREATVTYPDGVIEGWGAAQRHVGKPVLAKPEQEKLLTEEVGAEPSPELIAAIKRKEWIKDRELQGDPLPDTSDPQAWRFEMTG